MNDSNSEFDSTLADRFRREHAYIAPEPFVSNTLRYVAAERKRASVVRYVLQGLTLLVVIGASPWLIEASAFLSAELDDLVAKASALLGTPIGMGVAALGVAISAALLRLRTSR